MHIQRTNKLARVRHEDRTRSSTTEFMRRVRTRGGGFNPCNNLPCASISGDMVGVFNTTNLHLYIFIRLYDIFRVQGT